MKDEPLLNIKCFLLDMSEVIAFVRASAGRVPDLIVGKLNRMIVDTVASKFGLSIKEMAMPGDGLYTDIALSQAISSKTWLPSQTG